MVKRDPNARPYANGMPGGPENPLGARALYLYQDSQDTMYRIHGTNEPWTIGQAVSSGCIRMMNEDVIDLYSKVPVGTTVIVLDPDSGRPSSGCTSAFVSTVLATSIGPGRLLNEPLSCTSMRGTV